jgi:L-amino acid N-acyltransferase YncA
MAAPLPPLEGGHTMMTALDIRAPGQGNLTPAFDGEEPAWLPGLGAFHVRALRAADRAAYDGFGARLDRGDLRLRFAGPVKVDGPVFDAQFRSVDHDRMEAFAAVDADGKMLGIAHLARTGSAVAEIALIVRSDLKRRGLGGLLLDRLLRHAEALGLSELTAQILFENHPMLRLAAEAGFRIVGYNGGMADLRKDLHSLPRTTGTPSILGPPPTESRH